MYTVWEVFVGYVDRYIERHPMAELARARDGKENVICLNHCKFAKA